MKYCFYFSFIFVHKQNKTRLLARLDKERFDKLWGEQHKGSMAEAVKKQKAAQESSASGEGAQEGMAMKV